MQRQQMNDQSSNKPINFAEQMMKIIEKVSHKPNFQKKMIVLMLLISYFTNIKGFSTSLFYMNPVFECQGLNYKVSEDQACQMIQYCHVVDTETITNELSLYCDSKKSDRVLLQTAVGFGHWLGIILVGLLGDRKGRKMGFCVSLIVLNLTWICQFIGVYTKSVSLLLIAEFNSGVCNKFLYLNVLVLSTRFMNRQWYQATTLGWSIAASGFSQMTIAILNELFRNWQVIITIYAVGIFICSVASLILLKEDPLFTFQKGQINETKDMIKHVGQQNQENQESIEASLRHIDDLTKLKNQMIKNQDQKDHFNIREILRCDIFLACLIIGLAGSCYQMANKGIGFSIQNLQYSFNFNLFIVGLSNTIGYGTAFYLIRIEKQRKRGLIYTSLIYVIISMMFLFPFCTQNGIVETLVLTFLRIFLCYSGNFYTRLKVDTFPQTYQATLVGITEFLINFGTILGPVVVQISEDNKIQPIVSISVLRLIFGVLPVFALTQNRINVNQKNIQDEKVSQK